MKLFIIILLQLFVIINFQLLSQNPPRPVLTGVSVSITNDTSAVVKWSQEEGNYYISGFKIFRVNNSGVNDYLATVSSNSREWLDPDAPTDVRRCIYSVSLLWSTDPQGPTFETATSEEIFQTVHLKAAVEHNLCDRTNKLMFTEYQITGLAASYIILAQNDPIIGFLPIAEIQTSDLEIVDDEITNGANIPTNHRTNVYAFVHRNVEPNTNYIYKVKVPSASETIPESFSNTAFIETPPDPQPQASSIKRISVNDDGYISIEALIRDVELCSNAYLKRWVDMLDTPELVELPFPNENPLTVDDLVNSSLNAYYYEVVSKNHCDFEISGTGIHRSILLQGNIEDNIIVNLNWNHYEGWDVDTYEILRKQGQSAWVPIATLSGSSTSFTDDLLLLPDNESALSYKVVAIGDNFESQSNIVNLQPDYTPYFPSAFNPLSDVTENTVFKPISDLYTTNGYQLLVYDRWGGLVWSTSNPSEGWNGRDAKGKLCQKGVYVYQLSYKDQNNLPYQLNGSVTLIYY